jgi:F0F1-type ATP synthase membrane subunit a
MLATFSDLACELIVLLGCISVRICHPVVEQFFQQLDAAAHQDIIPGVFGDAEFPPAQSQRSFWLGLSVGVFAVYTGFDTSVLGAATPTALFHPLFPLAASLVFWFGALSSAIIRLKTAAANTIIHNELPTTAIGGILFLIELLSFATRAVSLGLRLFANLLSSATIESLVDAGVWGCI